MRVESEEAITAVADIDSVLGMWLGDIAGATDHGGI